MITVFYSVVKLYIKNIFKNIILKESSRNRTDSVVIRVIVYIAIFLRGTRATRRIHKHIIYVRDTIDFLQYKREFATDSFGVSFKSVRQSCHLPSTRDWNGFTCAFWRKTRRRTSWLSPFENKRDGCVYRLREDCEAFLRFWRRQSFNDELQRTTAMVQALKRSQIISRQFRMVRLVDYYTSEMPNPLKHRELYLSLLREQTKWIKSLQKLYRVIYSKTVYTYNANDIHNISRLFYLQSVFSFPYGISLIVPNTRCIAPTRDRKIYSICRLVVGVRIFPFFPTQSRTKNV